jgi:hypothetical protein
VPTNLYVKQMNNKDNEGQKITKDLFGKYVCALVLERNLRIMRRLKHQQEHCLSHVTSRRELKFLDVESVTRTFICTVLSMSSTNTINYIRILYCESRGECVSMWRRAPR